MEESVEPAVPEQPTPPPPSEWFGIWIRAVTRPKLETYQEIARRADVNTAYMWLVLAFLIPNVINMVLVGAFMLVAAPALGSIGEMGLDVESPALLIGRFGGVILACTIFEIAAFSVMTVLSNAIARAFGGVGDFRRLVYCFATYAVPVSIALMAAGILSGLSGIGSLIYLSLVIYPLVLNVIAIKAVHQIETWQAAVPSALIAALFLVIVACGVLGFLAMIDPSIGTVFSNVIESSR